MRFKSLILVFFALSLLILPAAAYTRFQVNESSSFDISAPSGLHIIQMETDRMHTPGVQTYTLTDSNNQRWYLQVSTTSVLNSYWDIRVSLTRPDGSVETQQLQSLRVAWDYKYTLQRGIVDVTSANIPAVDLSFYIGVGRELGVSFQSEGAGDTADFITFNRIIGASTIPTSWALYLVNPTDEQKVLSGDQVWNIENLINSAFGWTWQTVLDFVNMIPVIGPYVSMILEIVGAILAELFWWFNYLLIQNWDITLVIVECLILGHSLLAVNARGKPDFMVLFTTVYEDHLLLINAIIGFVELAIRLVMWVVDMASAIIKAIKPI